MSVEDRGPIQVEEFASGPDVASTKIALNDLAFHILQATFVTSSQGMRCFPVKAGFFFVQGADGDLRKQDNNDTFAERFSPL